MTTGDQFMREYASALPVPEFATTAFTPPPPLADACVAIVTTAAIHPAGEDGFAPGDTGFRVIDAAARDLRLGHWSPNFDRSGFAADLNVVYPIDRLEELAAAGVIGRVAPHHLSSAGNQPDDVATIRPDSGPAAAEVLRHDGVDVVLLTPV